MKHNFLLSLLLLLLLNILFCLAGLKGKIQNAQLCIYLIQGLKTIAWEDLEGFPNERG